MKQLFRGVVPSWQLVVLLIGLCCVYSITSFFHGEVCIRILQVQVRVREEQLEVPPQVASDDLNSTDSVFMHTFGLGHRPSSGLSVALRSVFGEHLA